MQNLSRHYVQCPAFSATPPTTQKSGLKFLVAYYKLPQFT